ncbi:CPBP family intramembrane glutamic endopeptidase [Halomicrobium urmianum]|uniref:CPBP family intramembrane glutamic endopeptidase n=1 Tax=Halomicrobium urmianum TaxID=1586233 RepID=UPI001CD92129|nr:type II CAAX endopeptidase family protein [Halomicrobium urmianum]
MSSDLYRPADTEVQVQSVLHAVGIVALAFGAGVILSLVGVVGVGILTGNVGGSSLATSVVGSVLQFAGFILVVVAYLAVNDDYDLVDWRVPTLSDVVWMAAAFAGLLVSVWIVGAIATALGVESAQNQVIVQGQQDPRLFLYMIPITILLVGPGEELLFRGAVQGLLRRAFGPAPAIAGASVLFGTAHVVALIGSDTGIFTYIAVAAILGVILGSVYEYTDNIVVPIVVHGFWNAMIFAAQYAIAVYDVPMPQ